MILMNFQAESKIKAKAKRAHRKEGNNDQKGKKPQAGQAQDLQKAVCLHGSMRKPYGTAGLPLDVEHLTLLWQTWDSSTLRGKRWILEASRHLQKAKQGTAAPGNPLWKETKGNLSCKKPEHMGIIALHFPYIWNNIVEPIKDHCNYFQKKWFRPLSSQKPSALIKEARKCLWAQEEQVAHQGLSEVSPRGMQECSDPSVHSSNLCEETIKRNPVWWHHHHTHVTFQHFLLRDSRFKNGTKFKLLGRMPVFLAFHQRLMCSTAHFCFPSIPFSCLQHSLVT